MNSPGTRSGPMIAAFLSVPPERVRDWARRGLIGRSCDVETRQEGYDVLAVARLNDELKPRRPRVALDYERWKSHAQRVA